MNERIAPLAQVALDTLAAAPVVPILVIDRVEDAVPLARALVDAGLPVLEITLRTPAAIDAIAAIVREVEGAIAGAGTVLDAAQFAAVQAAGGRFAIAPGTTDALYAAAGNADARIPLIPGIATPSELMRGLEHGYRAFKFFPAEAAGGPVALKAFAGPFPQARFCPTGGIDAAKAPGYLALPTVLTVGGSWMVPADAVAERDWARIRKLAESAAVLPK